MSSAAQTVMGSYELRQLIEDHAKKSYIKDIYTPWNSDTETHEVYKITHNGKAKWSRQPYCPYSNIDETPLIISIKINDEREIHDLVDTSHANLREQMWYFEENWDYMNPDAIDIDTFEQQIKDYMEEHRIMRIYSLYCELIRRNEYAESDKYAIDIVNCAYRL